MTRTKRNLIRTAGLLAVCLITMMSMLGLTACGSGVNLYEGLDLDEYLKVPEYKGVEVTKAEIGDAIVADLEANAQETELEKGDKVKEDDTINIDYVGKVDGKEFEGGTAQGQELTLGTGTFIDGFEEGLVGHKVGEKGIELKLAFPPNYQVEELQGKDVIFTVKINSARRLVQPEYNDEFVKSLGDYKNTEEYEKAVKETIAWSNVLADTEVLKYPENVVDHYIETFDKQIDYYAEQRGKERSYIIQKYYGAATEEDLKKQLTDYAQTLVKQEMLVEYIADKEGITYTEEEADARKKEIKEQDNTNKTVKRDTGRTMKQYVHIELLYGKVLDFLGENAKVK